MPRKSTSSPTVETVPMFVDEARKFLSEELVSRDERLTAYNELVGTLTNVRLSPCGDVTLCFFTSDFKSYGVFMNLLAVAFPQVPFTFLRDGDTYLVTFRKDVLLKYLLYSDLNDVDKPVVGW